MQEKPYSEMTEQEAKEWFGYAFRRTNPQDVPEAYVCTCTPEVYGSGYGVVAKEYDPYGKYDLDELKQYLEDYPEMNCVGWHKPISEYQNKLKEIRTEWTSWTLSALKEHLYSTQVPKFLGDDIWGGDDIDENEVVQNYLITWGESHMTCDRATELISQYAGYEDEKAEQVKELRNAGKAYLSTLAEAFYEAHHDKPEEPVFPIIIIND